jgi:hypothetical protein
VSVAALMKIPCTLLTRTQDGPADEYGNPTWTAVERPTVCELQLASAVEAVGDTVQVARFRAFLPADAPARGWDGIRLDDGTVLELAGDAWPVRNLLTDTVSHVEADVVRVE